eukprot:151301-Rhodomonas_salina.2
MPDADDEIYGRSFWGGLSHRDTSEAKLEGIAEDEEEEGTETDRLDTLKSGAGAAARCLFPARLIRWSGWSREALRCICREPARCR